MASYNRRERPLIRPRSPPAIVRRAHRAFRRDERTITMTDPEPQADEAIQADLERQAERDGLNEYPVAFLQNLIDTGEGWRWEGALGQAIVAALEDGTCVLGPTAHRDYYGRVVPARGDVAAGEKGSLEYANRLRAERGAPQLVVGPDGVVSEAAG
jgi:hypothetical protein